MICKNNNSILLLLAFLPFISIQLNAQVDTPSNIIINKLGISNGISSSISDIFLDKNENLWIAQINQSLIKFNGTAIEKKPVYIKSNSLSSVSTFVTTKENELNFSADHGTYLLQLNKNDTISVYKDLLKEEGLIYGRYYLDKNMIHSFLKSTKTKGITYNKIKSLNKEYNIIVLNYDTYLYKLDDSIFVYNKSTSKNITNLILNKGLLINIFSYNGQLFQLYKNDYYLIDIENNKNTKLDIDPSIATTIASTTLKNKAYPVIRFYSNPNLFILNQEYLFEIESYSQGKLNIKLICQINFIKSSINQILKNSRDGNIFISTDFDGVYTLKNNQFYYPFNKEYIEFSKKKVYFPITVTSDNSIFSLWGVINPKTGYSKIINKTAPGEFATMMGPDSTYWASHDTNKVLHFDRNFKVLKKYIYGSSKRYIYHLSVNDKKEILLVNGKTIAKFSNDSFIIVKDFSNLIPENLILNKITNINKGIYLICSNNGLYIYNSELDKLTNEPVFENSYVLDVSLTKKNKDYIVQGYNSNHIYYRHDGTYFRIPMPENTGLQNIASLIVDNNDKIWIATDNGFYVTTIAELNDYCDKKSNNIFFYSYTLQDGLPSTEFNGGLHESSVLTKDGYLAFCSLKGLLLFRENAVEQVFPVNNVRINSIKIGDTLHPISDTIVGKGLSNNIRFSVTTPYFGNRSNLLIEYSIGNPSNRNWKPISNNEFNISELKIGTTQIFIRLKTGFGSNSYNYTTVTVINQPYFYQSTTFIVIISIAALSLFLFFLNTLRKSVIRKKIINLSKEKISTQNIQLEKKTQLLESTVNQLEAAIEEVNDSKLKLNESIQLKEKLISLIIHDLKSPLYSQSIILNQLLSTNQTQNNNLSPIIADLKASNNAILNFTKDFLLWYSLQENGFTIKQSSFPLAFLIEEISKLYSEISKQKNIPIKNKIDKQISVTCDRTLFGNHFKKHY